MAYALPRGRNPRVKGAFYSQSMEHALHGHAVSCEQTAPTGKGSSYAVDYRVYSAVGKGTASVPGLHGIGTSPLMDM